jgi:hypothetical protein
MGHTGDLPTLPEARGPKAYDALKQRERRAVRILLCQPTFLPGVVQIPDYATEMISRITGLKAGDPELRDRVDDRMQRAAALQERLRGDEPPNVVVVVDEATLRRHVGGREVMRKQLKHLRALAESPTVQLSIVPLEAGAHPGLAGPSELHEDANGEAAVFYETPYLDVLVTSDEARADRCRESVEAMVALGVSGSQAKTLLETIADGL